VSKWECGDGYPDIVMLPSIAQIFGVSLDELVGMQKICSNEEAEKILAQVDENESKGLRAENVALLHEAVKRFPNNYMMSAKLAANLFCLESKGEETSKTRSSEAAEIAEYILANCNDRKIIDDSMKKANCYSYRNENISSLSGGESQRVIIARAIAQQAGYMFLDEPIAHLDIKNQVELMETLKRLNKDENVTVIAVLHDLNLAAQYCDRLIMMKDGKVYAQGETSKICNGSNLKNVYGISFEEVRRADGSIVYMPESADV
jgi:ABC-type cobalamin/Fe3+-siderophores transport system ATPase subunit